MNNDTLSLVYSTQLHSMIVLSVLLLVGCTSESNKSDWIDLFIGNYLSDYCQ